VVHPRRATASAAASVSSYALAVGLGVVALAIGHWTPTRPDLTVLFLAVESIFVALSAWRGGLGPGIVCTALCLVSTAEWLEPARSLSVEHPAELVGLFLFVPVGVALSVICEQLRRTRAHAQRAAELEHAARRLRDEVIGMVTRDLSHPLVAIEVNAELIERDARADGRDLLKKRTKILHRSVARMRRLLLDLLDAANLETGDVVIHPSPVASGQLLGEAAELCRDEAEARKVRIVLDTPADAPRVRADRDRILQVLSQLVTRAVKVLPVGGQLLLSVEAHATHARFTVCESARAESERVSERFFHAMNDDEGGARLSLAAAIVRAHGGEVCRPSVRPAEPLSFTLPIA
jgi:signal transduction histidine kinase